MKILVAEDEYDLADVIHDMLEASGYSVDVAENGQMLLDMAEQSAYDVIISDIMMPVKDGLTAIKELRASGSLTPVLFLTAKTQVDDRIEGLDAGADDYLTKPFAMGELLARIRAMCRRKSEIAPNDLKMGNVTLKRATFELCTQKGELRLASKEFQMLEMLMNNPNVLISTERFMEKIWGYDSESEINVVWVYISYLRKKLTQLDADINIKAVRGAGYTLEKKVK